MKFYRAYRPGEQEVFPYSINAHYAERIKVLLSALQQASLLTVAIQLLTAILFRTPRYHVSLEPAIEIIDKSLREEFRFAQENKLSFECYLIRNQSELMFFPSYKPQNIKDYEDCGWLQRRILILRHGMIFWIFLPKP